MRRAVDDYRKAMLDLLFARAVRPVSMDEEERFAEEMDRHWPEMTPEEQEEAERWFKDRNSLAGPETLPFRDVNVAPSATTLPRRRQ